MAASVNSALLREADLGRTGSMRRRSATWRYRELTVPAIKSRSRAAAVVLVGVVLHRPRHQRSQPMYELQRARILLISPGRYRPRLAAEQSSSALYQG